MASDFTRRGVLGFGIAAASAMATRTALAAEPRRAVQFFNIHTNEKLSVTYWSGGKYIPAALAEVDHVLRDHRTGDTHRIEPLLLDLLVALRLRLDTAEPFHVISGYRSPKTNGLLARASHGVAKHSLHMEGRAIDIRVPGRELKRVHQDALALRAGGVGYYPKADFVHVDVGKVRHWQQGREV